MNLIKIVFAITFIALPSLTYSDTYSDTYSANSCTYSANSCMDAAKRALEKCLEDRPESQWGICEQRYYKAIKKC